MKITTERMIYNILDKHRGEWVNILDLFLPTYCMCIGAVCANLRKKWCIVDRKWHHDEKSGKTHSRYRLSWWSLGEIKEKKEEIIELQESVINPQKVSLFSNV